MTVQEFMHNYINRNVLISEHSIPITEYENVVEMDEKIKDMSTHCELYRIKTDDVKSHLFLVYTGDTDVRMNVDGAYFTFGVGKFSFKYGKYIICDKREERDILYKEYMQMRQEHYKKMRTISDSIPKDVFNGYQLSVVGEW